MKPILADSNLVAYCGLYCGACKKYLDSHCPGCHENTKASWCLVRKCCQQHQYLSCADCQEFSDPAACGKFSNIFAKIFGFIFKSDRKACIAKIKELGLNQYASFMCKHHRHSLPRHNFRTNEKT
ncbi:MAG: DUF3795 domain-containing protein [Deltaproteobacteria bacterium]|nr:DUF3795 domain-containing protein [Deltaproteobacteria bacterium]